MAMFELIQVTAQYSNAVLVAIMPYVSDFAHRLDLPVANPVTPSHVLTFKCDPRKGQTGGFVTLTNGFQFTFLNGRVCVYRSPKSYFSLQEPNLITNFYGAVKVSEKDALNVAHGVVTKLGYTDDMFHADRPPQITPPEKIETNWIARYRFKWLEETSPHPKSQSESDALALLDIEVDATTRQIQMVAISSKQTERPSPKIDVSPPVLQPPKSKEQLPAGRASEALSPAYSSAFLEAILPELSDFARKVGLPIAVPITTNQVDLSKYLCRRLEGQTISQIVLKNGDRFNYEHGRFVAYYAHDAYLKFPEHGRVEDFLGKINMSTNEAIAICERAIKNVGFKAKLPKPFFGGSTFVGTNEFSRYIFYWRKPQERFEFASFEVDMESKIIKSLYINDPSLWREPPKINLPMNVETTTSK